MLSRINDSKILTGHICTMPCGYKTPSPFIITFGIQSLQQCHVQQKVDLVLSPYCNKPNKQTATKEQKALKI